MAEREGKFRLYNRIWFLAISLVLFILTLWGVADNFMPSALALEQESRCQMEEHIHTDTCYIDNMLACTEKAHVHSESCYLILLRDNDINTLLIAVDNTRDNSLEGVIQDTLTQALASDGVTAAGENLSFVGGTEAVEPSATPTATPTPTPTATSTPDPSPSTTRGDEDPQPSTTRGDEDPQPSTTRGDAGDAGEENPVAVLSLTGTTLTDLNETIEEENIQPSLTLNTGLYAARAVADELNSGISTYAVGGSAQTGSRQVNFYFLLDGKVTFVYSASLSNSNPDYYSYQNTAKVYSETADVISGLTSSNIGSTYRFKYNTTGSVSSASNFGTNATYNNNRLGMGNNSNTRYAILTSSSGSAINFWTVTLDYSEVGGSNQVQYVQNGLNSTLTPDSQYDWEFADGTAATADDLDGITGTLTLYARPKGNVVTFESNGGTAVADQLVDDDEPATEPTAPTRTGYTFAGWYRDAALTTAYNFSTPVTGNITLYAKWTPNIHTITYYDSSGALLYTDTAQYGSSYTLRDAPDGQVWFSGSTVSAGTVNPVTGDLTLRAGLVVICNAAGGNTTVSGPYTPDTRFIVPGDADTVWQDDDGNQYHGGQIIVLSESLILTELAPLTVIYNVNFSDSGLSSGTGTPVLAETGLTSATITVPHGEGSAIYSVTPRTYISAMNGEAAHFEGWVPAGDTSARIEPGTNLTWAALSRYAVDGVVTLNGDWARDGTNNITDVRFYVRFDSIAPDFTGNVGSYGTNYYTSQIYHAYAGNAPAHNSGFTIADVTPDNSYTVDQNIRSLVGDKGDGELWISGVPDDQWMFEQLKEFTRENSTQTEINNNQYLRIYVGEDQNGNDVFEDVLASELNTDHYSLRWYVFKKESDGWHIDGRLVKKEGVFKVDKAFGGIEDAVGQAREGFYILAENGTLTNGVFTPYANTNSAYNAHILVLDQATASTLKNRYPNATIQICSTGTNAEGQIVEEWLVTGGKMGEVWRFTEMAVLPQYTDPITGAQKYYSWYAEYTVSDSDGEYSQVASFGSSAIIPVKTYALDKDPDQGLSVDFTNYYYSNESILIRKIDGDTGLPLGGAEFQLWQGGQQLKFRDGGSGIYSVSPSGTIGSITTNSEGFSVITVDSFSYENGELVVKEVTAPDGYAVINDVTVDYLNGTDGNAGIVGIAGVTDPADYPYHAEYHDENGGILVVKDHAAFYTTVTARKVWADAVTAEEVTVVLQANGSRASNIFPNLTQVETVLNATNNWTYTWEQLPAYANGELVSWSIKEVRIGTETAMVGSDTFANWIVVYSTPVQTDTDGDGITDNWAVTVTNTVRRSMLNVIKTNADASQALSGALFTLTEVEWNAAAGQWIEVQNGIRLSAESASDGRLLFDGLAAGRFYCLTEVRPPNGHLALKAPVYLTVNGMGVVYGATDGAADNTTLNAELVSYTGPYVITVRNVAPVPLPSTGGTGTAAEISAAGAALMAAALLLLGYQVRKRRREDDLPYA